MVRVTHPPGGRPKLDCEEAPPKAVRVLKPPGGGSSISFGDDDVPVVKAKAVAPASTPPAEADASNGDCSSDAAAGGDDAPSSASTQAEAPSTPSSEPDSNGTAPSSPTKSASVDDFPPSKVDSSSETVSADAPATNGSASNGEVNGKAESVTTNGTGGDHVNGKAEFVSTNGVGETNGHSAHKTNGTSEDHTNGTCENVAPAESSSPACSPSPPSGSPQPSSPTPLSPGVNSPDTRDRLFGATAAPPKAHVVRSTPSNHHMRSSIFGSSDEPLIVKPNSRGPSATSPTKEKGGKAEMAAAPQQQAPIRVRQPPGGYSSQLW